MKRAGKKRGLFIVFEGGEGAGKSTQIRYLLRWLRCEGIPHLFTRQPGGTSIGIKIRRILLDPKSRGLSPRAELLLYEADRAQHVEEAIRPALHAGKIVVSDRFSDSSTVYQGMCRNLGADKVIALNDFATAGLSPDLVILLDLPERTARKRIESRARLDRMESEKRAFHRKVRKGFLTLASRFPDRIKVVKADQSEVVIATQIRALIAQKMK